MNVPLVIGLDLGTTHCKAIAVTPQGAVADSATCPYPLYTPQPGWAEQDAGEVWRGAVQALRALAGQINTRQAAGLCLGGAMHSLLPVSAAGEPLARATTWADQRAASQLPALQAATDAQALYQRTGCPLQAIYHPARLRWWQAAAPEIARQAARFVALRDFVLYQLTGAWATDFGLASTTGLLDIHRLAWEAEALKLAGVTHERLPALVPPHTVVGHLTPAAAASVGLPAGLPVVAGGSDGGLANLGAGAATPGQRVVSVGTSGAVRQIVAEPWLDPQARTWCYALVAERWFAGGAINNAGLAVQWVREQFYADVPAGEGYARLLADAASVPAGAGGVLCLPYLTGERSPHWNPGARAALFGLDLTHTRAHIARAVLEGVAFCLTDVWQALPAGELAGRGGQAGEQTEPAAFLTGSITRSPTWAQIVADVLGSRLLAAEAADASAIGAALLGHWALGTRPALEAPVTAAGPATTYEPDAERHALYAELHTRFQQLYQAIVQT